MVLLPFRYTLGRVRYCTYICTYLIKPPGIWLLQAASRVQIEYVVQQRHQISYLQFPSAADIEGERYGLRQFVNVGYRYPPGYLLSLNVTAAHE